MTHTTTISEDTILGAEHPGMTILVDAVAAITLPKEDTYKFIENDEFEIISDTNGSVTVAGEEGVTVYPLSNATITNKGSSVKVQYQGNDTYLMWGSLCIALIAGVAALVYSNNTLSGEATLLINWIR